MTANVSEIIRASAAQRSGTPIFKFLNIYFVECGVAVILYPENSSAKQVVILHQLHKPDSMDLFSSADHFVGAMCVNVLDKVR